MWAFATSAAGLGLSEARFWSMTMREYRAIKAVWKRVDDRPEELAARILAVLHNAHFQTDGVPWMPADFMGEEGRSKRVAEHAINKANGQMADVALSQMKPGEVPDGLPSWALGDK